MTTVLVALTTALMLLQEQFGDTQDNILTICYVVQESTKV